MNKQWWSSQEVNSPRILAVDPDSSCRYTVLGPETSNLPLSVGEKTQKQVQLQIQVKLHVNDDMTSCFVFYLYLFAVHACLRAVLQEVLGRTVTTILNTP